MVPLGWGCCGHCPFDSPFSPVHFAHRFTLRLESRALRFHLVRGVVDNIVMFPLTTSRLVGIDKVTPPRWASYFAPLTVLGAWRIEFVASSSRLRYIRTRRFTSE